MFNELLKNVMNLGIITADDVKRLTAPELMILIIERTNGLLNHVEIIDEKLTNLLENIRTTTIEELNKWTQDGTFDTLLNQSALKKVNDRIDETNAQLSVVERDVSRIANTLEKFGAVGDGETDDTEAIQKAFDNGGVILFGKNKTYKFTSPLSINNSNVTIVGNGATLKYDGDGTEGRFILITGTNADAPCENVELTNLTIDGTNQRYKGGSEDNWLATSASPRYYGAVGIEIKFCKNVKIKNTTLNDIYGGGIVVRRSAHITIDENKVYDCSGGNIVKNDYTGWDSFGDGITSFFSYNVTISNNIVINKRRYKVSGSDSAVNEVLGQLCGRSGLEFEYSINADGKNDDPKYNAPGYPDFLTREGFGLLMFNNYVYGYTKGIHLEANVRCQIDKNKVIRCHIGILHTGGQETMITNNYICNENLGKCPQIGYDAYCGGIALTQYSSPNLTSVIGNVIDLENERGDALKGITIGRTCAHIINNKITAKYGIWQLRNKMCTSNGIFITNNEMFSYKGGYFIFKYYADSTWKICNNIFTCKDNDTAVLHIESTSINSLPVPVSNNIFTNSFLNCPSSGASNIIIDSNTFKIDDNITEDSSVLRLQNINFATVKNNHFYINTPKVRYVVHNIDGAKYTTIKNNIIDFINEDIQIECCFFMPGYQTALNVSDNIVKLPANKTSYIMLRVNWRIGDFILKNNKFIGCNPSENYILNSGSSAISGFIDINNNNGVVPNTHMINSLVSGKYYNNGDILIDYRGSENRNYVGRVCVRSGYYTTDAWRANKSYAVNDVFYNGDNVYKVLKPHTAPNSFVEDDNIKRVATLPVFKDYGAINH